MYTAALYSIYWIARTSQCPALLSCGVVHIPVDAWASKVHVLSHTCALPVSHHLVVLLGVSLRQVQGHRGHSHILQYSALWPTIIFVYENVRHVHGNRARSMA